MCGKEIFASEKVGIWKLDFVSSAPTTFDGVRGEGLACEQGRVDIFLRCRRILNLRQRFEERLLSVRVKKGCVEA